MEFVGPIWSVMGSIKMLMDITAKKRELDSMVVDGLKSMNQDFEIILAVRLARKEMQLAPGIQSQLQDLAYEIDDFIQDLWDPGEWGSFILSAIAADSRPLHIQRINYFKDSLKTLKEELPTSFDGQHAGQSSSVGSPIPYAPDLEDLVGIEGPKKEILELLSPRVEPHVGRLSVISIVGCSGSGKTALARVLYQDDNVTERFDFKSWVVASDPSSVDIVNNIRQQVFRTSAPGSTPEALHDFQKDKRYLIVVDDVVRETPLKEIKKALGENDMDSRIIVITRVPSIVRDYSSGSFEYTMQGLDQENSRKLFRVKFIRPDPYTEEVKLRLGDKDVDKIIDKCDGLPIALISAAERLRGKGQRPGSEHYKQVSQELGRYLACSDSDFEDFRDQNRTEVAFAEMRRARVEPYENLLNHSEKLCLLYVSMFPCGHQIISKNLARRLIAEGLVTGDSFYAGGNSDSVVGDARECVRKLMEHHMIEPVPARNYSNVAKRCRVHSIMLQFTIKKAVSRNLLGMIHEDDQPLRSPNNKLTVRRLTIQSGLRLRKECPTEEALSVLRSLAIFKMERIILDLGKCKRVRVLDLEGCRGLTRTDLDNICLLLFLKYLSLRNTAIPADLPGNMKNLKFLETLDTRGRGTQLVIKLPIQVLTLPQLAYLFGKFELTNLKQQQNVEELTNFFSKESALHTLGGIAVHEEKGLEIVLLVVQHATKLKKVKVWFMNTPKVGETSQPCLFRRAMQRFNPPRLFKRLKPSSAGPEENPINIGRNTHDDPAPATCTPPPGRLPCAGQLAAHSSSNAQDPAPATCTPPGFPSAGAGPSVYSIGNAHDPTPATSSTAEPIPGATGPAAGLSTRKWYTLLTKPKWKRILHRLFTGWKLSAGQSEARRRGIFKHKKKHFGILSRWNPSAAANPTSNAAQDPAPTTCTRVTGGAPGLPSAGAGPSEGSSGGNTPEPAPATSTPLASDTRELIHCASRLTNTLLEHHGKLESVFIDFNGVPNTFPNFLRINGTISSIKLRRAQIILPGREMLGIVGNLKKLHLFSTGLESKQLASLQYLTCLQYLQLEEEGDGLWNSEFHVQARGFISLICLCFESSNSRPPPLKIDEGVTTPLASLLLLCKETHPRVEGICHLAKLNEVILHPSATDYVVTAWKEQAKKHINIPHVEKKKKPV